MSGRKAIESRSNAFIVDNSKEFQLALLYLKSHSNGRTRREF